MYEYLPLFTHLGLQMILSKHILREKVTHIFDVNNDAEPLDFGGNPISDKAES